MKSAVIMIAVVVSACTNDSLGDWFTKNLMRCSALVGIPHYHHPTRVFTCYRKVGDDRVTLFVEKHGDVL